MQIKILEAGLSREKRNLTKQLKELKTDMHAFKVSFVYIHLICSVISSCYLWSFTGSSEWELLACAVLLGLILKLFLIQI